MRTNQRMAEYITSKKAAALKAAQGGLPPKGMMNRSFFANNKPSPDRNGLEARAKYKSRITRGAYVSDAIAARFGV